jgi:hypothetical protein
VVIFASDSLKSFVDSEEVSFSSSQPPLDTNHAFVELFVFGLQPHKLGFKHQEAEVEKDQSEHQRQ